MIFAPSVSWWPTEEAEPQNAYSKAMAVKTYTDAGYISQTPEDQKVIREGLGLPIDDQTITPDAGDEDIIREDLGLPRGSAET